MSDNSKTNIATQFYIYNYLDRKDVLFEFLYRAKYNEFVKHINTDIVLNNPFPGYNNIDISTEIKVSNSYTIPDIYVLVKFVDKTTMQQFGHMTFHLVKKIINNNFQDGPLHIVNERSGKNGKDCRRRQKLRLENFDKNTTYKGIKFSLGGCKYYKCTVEEPLPQLSSSVINVLNKYFNPADELSLLNKIDPSFTDSVLDSFVTIILFHNKGIRVGGINTLRRGKSEYILSHTRKRKHYK